MEYFEKNRYDFSQLIEDIKKLEKLPEVIDYHEMDIQIYNCNHITKETLVDVLENFNILDNMHQDYCKEECEKHSIPISYYQFAVNWIEFSDGNIVVGYFGICCNTNFDVVFSKVNGMWSIMK